MSESSWGNGYPGDAITDEANTLRELLAHPVILRTIKRNAQDLTDLSDTAFETMHRLLTERCERKKP